MSVSILPRPPVLWDYYISGPFTQNATLALNFPATLAEFLTPGYSPDSAGGNTPRAVWTFSQSGAGVNKDRVWQNGMLCWSQATTVVAGIEGMGGININVRTDRTGMEPGFINPSWRRVNWLTLNMAMDVGTLDRNSGVILITTGGAMAAPIWPIAPAAAWTNGFGVVGDGAGNWNWENYANGFPGTPVRESVSLASAIPNPDQFNTFDFVFVAATGTRPARFELHLNGELFLQRNWETGITLLHPQTAGPAQNRWQPVWQNGTTSGDFIFISDWEYRAGRFLPDGRELPD